MHILIADDHAIVRKGLIQILRDEFPAIEVKEVANSQEVLESVESHTWDVILLDISMPGRSGIDTLKDVRARGVKAPILVLSMHPEEQYAIRALKAGASGFMNKENTTEELLNAIHRVLSGRKYITPSVAEKLIEMGDTD